ncbi:MAG: hypothetical protein Ct9H300mP12_06350 [Acidimicrobiales bacterium]|nr:MAG: hypothetical protein Ct9H300mP12_06350 [Acidimicrobiales bacterium]
MGTRFLLTADSDVADEVKAVYLSTSVTGTVVTRAVDGAPQRVVATDVVARLERSRLLGFPRAALNALRFSRGLTSTSLRELVAEGPAHEAVIGDDVEPGGDGRQRPDAHPGQHG